MAGIRNSKTHGGIFDFTLSCLFHRPPTFEFFHICRPLRMIDSTTTASRKGWFHHELVRASKRNDTNNRNIIVWDVSVFPPCEPFCRYSMDHIVLLEHLDHRARPVPFRWDTFSFLFRETSRVIAATVVVVNQHRLEYRL